ncbi:hypothetical protein Sa4125_28750 [Aureimonas sp. SA4125]|uniref:hypothetical protein n=1 Tax=Aureimonas sp. SA4125 TaxID=2826993 RepID=UPI001CC64B4D|nr:hypothetical protein [Aureimonas sp. SA4125]BDA85333.1 hypothetical protein Sa4125_28750 [Aureimonas sp. SA4125]
MTQLPEREHQNDQDDVHVTVGALVQMLINAGIQPGKIKGSLTKSAKPSGLVALEECLATMPRTVAGARRG